jgi:hypothetical protein
MRNVWKGLVVGGLTGVAAGLILDLMTEAAEQAGEAGRKVKGRAPDLASKVQHVAAEAAEALREADLPEKARLAAEQLREAELGEKAKRVAERTAERAREVDLRSTAKEAADRARDSINR